MKILSAEQIRAVDEYTIANEPVSSIDLMERAAILCARKLMRLIGNENKVLVVCGKGNNGGDGFVIARLLMDRGFDVKVFVVEHRKEFSPDAQTNYDIFKEKFPEKIFSINNIDDFKDHLIWQDCFVIDAIFGSGLNKPVMGIAEEVIKEINKNFQKVISIDVPSGLFADESSKDNNAVIRSLLTFTFQFPKLSFLMPENKDFVPEFEIVDIGLHQGIISIYPTNQFYLGKEDILPLLKRRMKFDHKGTYGHALLVAGSKGKSGAAIISAKACMRSGAGLLTVHSNKETLNALLNHLPEAMGNEDQNADMITDINPENYSAVAFGPGVGTSEETQSAFKKLLNYYRGKFVIDADGLNILSENKTWLSFLPPGTILTPHPKEFERLVGKSDNDFERLKTLKQFSLKNNCIVILKGAHSCVAMPDGNVFFNSSGNPSLAKAGSGDALTGIILGLLARGYNSPQAALIGTYIHGYAADLCLKKMSMESVLISDVIAMLPRAFRKLEEIK